MPDFEAFFGQCILTFWELLATALEITFGSDNAYSGARARSSSKIYALENVTCK